MWGIEGKEEVVVWDCASNSEDLLLFGRGYGEEKERKRTLQALTLQGPEFYFFIRL